MAEVSSFLIKRKKSGQEIKVLFDKEDLDKVKQYKWQYHPRGAIFPLERGKNYLLLHKFILETNKRISFLNENRFDCRKENLVSEIINPLNRRRKVFKTKENGKIEGIFFDNKGPLFSSYNVHIKIDNIKYCVKSFLTRYENALDKAIEYRKWLLNLSNEQLVNIKYIREEIKRNKKFNQICRQPTDQELKEIEDLLPLVIKLINARVYRWIPNSLMSFGDFRQKVLIDFTQKYVKYKDRDIEKYNQNKYNKYLGKSNEEYLKMWIEKFITNRFKPIINKIYKYTNHVRKSLDSCNDKSARAKGHNTKEDHQITIKSTLPDSTPSFIDFDSSIKKLDNLAKMEFTKDEFDIYQKMKNDENFIHLESKNIKAKLLEMIRENDLVLDN